MMDNLPDIVDDEIMDDDKSPLEKTARGREALKSITMAAGRGSASAFKFTSQEIINPLVSMTLLSELPLLVPLLDKTTSAMRMISSGIGGMFKKAFSKDDTEIIPSIQNESSISDSFDYDAGEFEYGYLDDIISILGLLAENSEFQRGVLEGLLEGVQEMLGLGELPEIFQDGIDTLKENFEDIKTPVKKSSTESLLNKEKLFESANDNNNNSDDVSNVTTKISSKKKGVGGLLGMIPQIGIFKVAVLGIIGLVAGIVSIGVLIKKLGLKKVLSKSKEIVSSIFSKVFDSLKFVGKLIWDNRIAIGSKIMNAYKAIYGAIWKGIKYSANLIWENKGKIGSFILTGVQAYFSKVLEIWKFIGTSIWENKGKIGSLIFDATKALFGRVFGIFKSIGTSIWENKGKISKSMVDSSVGIFNKVMSLNNMIIGKISDKAKEITTNGISLFKDAFMKVIDFTLQLPKHLLNFVKGQISNIPFVGRLIKDNGSSVSQLNGTPQNRNMNVESILNEKPLNQRNDVIETVFKTDKAVKKTSDGTQVNAYTSNVNNVNNTHIVQPRSYALPARNIMFGF